jgi:hypothetical protein
MVGFRRRRAFAVDGPCAIKFGHRRPARAGGDDGAADKRDDTGKGLQEQLVGFSSEEMRHVLTDLQYMNYA